MVICVKNTMSFGSWASFAISSNRSARIALSCLEPGRILARRDAWCRSVSVTG